MMVAFFGAPSPMELLIIGAICLLPLAAVAVVLVVAYAGRSSRAGNPNLRPCPDCRIAVSIHAATCPRCGCPLSPPPGGRESGAGG
jgi:hypothetical protein